MLESFAHDLTYFLHANPHWGSIIAFIVAFAESLAVIGTIIPGSVTMTAIGVMIGTAVLPLTSTFLWAIFGALVGDYLGYWIGKNFSEQIRGSRWLKSHQHWIQKGEDFFQLHGGKSVIIGRFFGPVRSLIPLIAGLLKMKTLRFTLAVFPAAFLWAVVYITPGILLGAVALELPPAIATKFIFYGFLIIILSWLVTRTLRLFFNQIWHWCDHGTTLLWQAMRRKKSLHWFTNMLAEPSDPDNHQQLMLSLLLVLFSTLFLCITWSVVHHGVLTYFNEPIYHLLTSVRTKTLDLTMVSITIMGQREVMFGLGAIVLASLVWKKKYRAAVHWFLLVFIGAGIAFGIKHTIYNPRPNLLVTNVINSSFPSGHVTLITLLLGYLSVLISHELPTGQKHIPYRISMILIAAVMFSRLYLGAHWLTDTLASLCLATSIILFFTISYRRHLVQHISPYKLAILSATSLFILTLGYGIVNFHHLLEDYRQPQQIVQMTSNEWWGKKSNAVPQYRNNRLGKPKEILNIQWQSDLDAIKTHLTEKNWESVAPNTSLKNLLKRAAIHENGYRLSLMPQQYNYAVPVLLMVKNNLVFRLWPSDVRLIDDQKPLWLGSITPMLHHRKKEHQLTDAAQIKKLITSKDMLVKITDLPDNVTLPANLQPLKQIIKIKEKTP